MYEVYLTPGGPKILEGPQRIAIVQSVMRGNHTFGEILKDTEFSKSSAYTFIKKLVAEGYLEERKDGKGINTYLVSNLPLIELNTHANQAMRNVPLFDMVGVCDRLERWVFFNTINGSKVSGLTMTPMISLIMRDLGERAYERDAAAGRLPSFDGLTDLLEKCYFADVTVRVGEVPEFDVRLKFEVPPEKTAEYGKVIVSAFCGYISKSRKIDYIPVFSEYGTNPNTDIVIKLIENTVVPLVNRTYFVENMDSACDFTLYYANGQFIPVLGDILNKILAQLSRLPASSQTLSEMFDIPQSTMSGYLKKLEADGVISQNKVKKNVEYIVSSLKGYDWFERNTDNDPLLREALDNALDNPEHAIRYLFHYQILIGYAIGFNMNVWAHFIGKRAGMNIVSHTSGMSVEQIFDLITEHSGNLFSSRIAFVSSSPLTVTILSDYDLPDFLAENYQLIYNAMFTSFMENLSDIPYRPRITQVYGNGNRGYKAVFVPIIR